MSNLVPIDAFSDVYQLETTDQVVGGPGGKSNLQAQALANRDLWLANRLAALTAKTNIRGVEQVSGINPINIEANDFSENKIVCISGDADPSLVVELPEIADFDDSTIGWSIAFKNCGQFDDSSSQQGFGINLRIKCDGSEQFLVQQGAAGAASLDNFIDLAIGDMIEITVFKNGGGDFFFFVTQHEKVRVDNNKTGVLTLTSVVADTALTVADLNKMLIISVASSASYRLPPISDVPDNTRVNIMYGTGLNNFALKNNAADGGGNIVFNSVLSNTQLSFSNAKHTAELLKLGNKWYVINTTL